MWCKGHKAELPNFLFYPNQKYCKDCVKGIIQKKNAQVLQRNIQKQREQEAILHLVSSLQHVGELFLYLISHDNRYKLGISKNIVKRIKTFNTAHAKPCRIVGIAKGTHKLEKQLHTRFAPYHVHGEWFLKDKTILDAFAALDSNYIFLPGYMQQEARPQPCDMGASSQ